MVEEVTERGPFVAEHGLVDRHTFNPDAEGGCWDCNFPKESRVHAGSSESGAGASRHGTGGAGRRLSNPPVSQSGHFFQAGFECVYCGCIMANAHPDCKAHETETLGQVP